MMNGGDLFELAKILGHSNTRMTERYAKLGKNELAGDVVIAVILLRLRRELRKVR
jgi:site-specific recombinase XerD